MTEEQGGPAKLMKQFGRASAGVMIANAVALPLGFVIHIYAARVLGTDSYGEYSIAVTCANLLVIPLCFGLHTGTVRFLPAYTGTGELGKRSGFLRFSRWLCLLLSVFVALLGALVIWVGSWPISASLERALLCLTVQLPALSLFTLYCSFLQSQRRVVLQAVARSLVRPFALLAGLAVAAPLLSSQPMAALVVLIETLAIALTLGGVAIASKESSAAILAPQPIYETALWLGSSARLVVLQSFVVIQNWADVLLVGVFLGAPQAGVYAIARRLARLVDFLLEATIPFVAPVAAKYYAQGRILELRRIVLVATLVTGATGLLLAAGLASLGDTILRFFGEDFTAGHGVLMILLVGHALNALTGPAGAVLVMTGHERFCTKLMGLTALACVALNLILIPRAGLSGAAWTNVVCLAGSSLLLLLYLGRVLRKTPVDPACPSMEPT